MSFLNLPLRHSLGAARASAPPCKTPPSQKVYLVTTSPRTRLWSTLATAAVLLVALTGLAAPAQAATARSLTTKASPALEYGGTQVTFSGTLSKSPKGSTVKIKLKSGTSYVTAA